MPERAVETLATAVVGDLVWLFDSQRTAYVDGKYAGRGVWTLQPIAESTRQSFVVRNEKFDRKTGYARTKSDYNTGNEIAGEVERENRRWLDARRDICATVYAVDDAAKLRAIAEIIGWKHPTQKEST